MPKQVQKKRTKYFIAPEFQLRYIRVILLIMFGVGAISAYTVYYQSMVFLGGKLASVYPQGRLVAIVKSVNTQILFSLLLITPLVIVIGLVLSHRIAGPIHRLEKCLAGIADGDITTYITLRKRDELKSLADGINLVIKSLRGKVTEEVEIIKRLHKEIGDLEGLSNNVQVEPERLKKEIKEEIGHLYELIVYLDKSVSQYKI